MRDESINQITPEDVETIIVLLKDFETNKFLVNYLQDHPRLLTQISLDKILSWCVSSDDRVSQVGIEIFDLIPLKKLRHQLEEFWNRMMTQIEPHIKEKNYENKPLSFIANLFAIMEDLNDFTLLERLAKKNLNILPHLIQIFAKKRFLHEIGEKVEKIPPCASCGSDQTESDYTRGRILCFNCRKIQKREELKFPNLDSLKFQSVLMYILKVFNDTPHFVERDSFDSVFDYISIYTALDFESLGLIPDFIPELNLYQTAVLNLSHFFTQKELDIILLLLSNEFLLRDPYLQNKIMETAGLVITHLKRRPLLKEVVDKVEELLENKNAHVRERALQIYELAIKTTPHLINLEGIRKVSNLVNDSANIFSEVARKCFSAARQNVPDLVKRVKNE